MRITVMGLRFRCKRLSMYSRAWLSVTKSYLQIGKPVGNDTAHSWPRSHLRALALGEITKQFANAAAEAAALS
eukprot:3888503-Amphidinium_carterae.1